MSSGTIRPCIRASFLLRAPTFPEFICHHPFHLWMFPHLSIYFEGCCCEHSCTDTCLGSLLSPLVGVILGGAVLNIVEATQEFPCLNGGARISHYAPVCTRQCVHVCERDCVYAHMYKCMSECAHAYIDACVLV